MPYSSDLGLIFLPIPVLIILHKVGLGIKGKSLFLSVVILREKVNVQLCPKSEPTLCCVTLVGFGVSGFEASAATVGAVECTMTLTAAPMPGITALGFDVTDSITVLVGCH